MKGTLFSADFIEDKNGNLRLLEVNTDTSVTNLTFFDYTDFISLLQSNNITKVIVIHKPLMHQEMVDHLHTALNNDASFITTFEEVKVTPNVIYPPAVSDEEGTFILRLAYDETSIFDSEYAKDKLNLLSLFCDGNESGSVVEFYHSSSVYGEYNTINDMEFNNSNLPDVVVKNITESHRMADFYKIGSEVADETIENRWNNFINTISNEDNIIQKYHNNPNSLVDNTISSIRVYSIVYGSNLDLVNISEYRRYATFDLPTGSIYDDTKYVNKLDTKHFFEFATNYIKYDGQSEGLLNTHLIIKEDGSEVEAGNLSVGDYLKSYYIGETSLDENDFYLNAWQITGSTLPSGSYMTSSVLMYKNVKPLDNKTLIKLTVNNNEDSLYISPIKTFLVHDSLGDVITWKAAIDINVNTDYLLDYDASTAVVSSNEFFITNDDGFSLVELDVEDTDTYIIAGTTPINSFITHNAPCFVAGTMITLADGSMKKIEDVVAGDVVSTFDLVSNTKTENVVNAVLSKSVNEIVEYKLDNGEVLKCTLDHPIFVEGKGWSSFNSDLSNEMYSLETSVKQIEIGDKVKLLNGDSQIVDIIKHNEETIVYNLQDIENNHNFFANNILVHNRFCFVAGTKILMYNGESKNIEDVKVDDEVLSFNEEKGIIEIKKVISTKQPLHNDLVKYVFDNSLEVTSTHDHPFYVNGLDLASFKPLLTNERYNLGKEVKQIKVGDVVNSTNSEAKIVSIIELPEVETQTYIITVEDNHNFYANGILVHNK
jgi:intein/homing endonuclease